MKALIWHGKSGMRREEVHGWQNELQVALGKIMPETMVARQHSNTSAPGPGSATRHP